MPKPQAQGGMPKPQAQGGMPKQSAGMANVGHGEWPRSPTETTIARKGLIG